MNNSITATYTFFAKHLMIVNYLIQKIQIIGKEKFLFTSSSQFIQITVINFLSKYLLQLKQLFLLLL